MQFRKRWIIAIIAIVWVVAVYLVFNFVRGIAYYNRGIAYYAKDQYEQAISEFTKTIEINPKRAKAYYNRGIAYAKKDLYDQAISDYDKALEISPGDTKAHLSRGAIYCDVKSEYDQAISDYSKALEINPGDTAAYNNRGWSTTGRENMTKHGRMSTRHKVWDSKFVQDFSRIFVKLQKEKSELSQANL